MRVAFIVASFPQISETFIINQVADLLNRDICVEIFAYSKPAMEKISTRYAEHRMSERTHYLTVPSSKLRRLIHAIPIALRLLLTHPCRLARALNFVQYGKRALSLRLLYSIAPFTKKKFDIVHCHFGDLAADFLTIREVLGWNVPLLTTFYGYDVSMIFNQSSPDFYDRLKRECSLFFVMSKDMKQRVVARGFSEDKVKIHPVSIDVDSYPFRERKPPFGKPIEIVSVGRFVEKKGFDDLLRALAIVRGRTNRTFRCSIIGGGVLEGQLRNLTSSLGLQDLVDFKGYMKVEDIIQLLTEKHIMVQASKTATNGDME